MSTGRGKKFAVVLICLVIYIVEMLIKMMLWRYVCALNVMMMMMIVVGIGANLYIVEGTTTRRSLPHRILFDMDVDKEDFSALLYLLKLNRSQFHLQVHIYRDIVYYDLPTLLSKGK